MGQETPLMAEDRTPIGFLFSLPLAMDKLVALAGSLSCDPWARPRGAKEEDSLSKESQETSRDRRAVDLDLWSVYLPLSRAHKQRYLVYGDSPLFRDATPATIFAWKLFFAKLLSAISLSLGEFRTSLQITTICPNNQMEIK